MAKIKKAPGEKVVLTFDPYTVKRVREIYGDGHLGNIVRYMVVEAISRRPVPGEQMPLVAGGGGKP